MQHATAAGALVVPATPLTASEMAAVAFLARYSGNTRQLYTLHVRIYFAWCAENRLDPLTDVQRAHVELFVRYLQDVRRNSASTISNRVSAIKGFYKFAHIDGLITRNPAEHALIPRVHHDDVKILGLDRLEFGGFLAASRVVSPQHHALAVLLGLLGMRVSEACSVQIGDFDYTERGHRVIKFVGKGNKPATAPLPAPVARALDAAKGDRTTGPLLTRRKDGAQLDRHTAGWMVQTIARHAGITKRISPHSLRHSFVTNALDAGIPLRDVQEGARHADPRTTMRYDRARGNLDRHAAHILSAYVAGAA
jgi:integrase/recombinase XerD